MIDKKMLYNSIEEAICSIEQNGEKVWLKTLLKKRIIYTIIFYILFLFYMSIHYSVGYVVMLKYFFILYRTHNASVIAKLAKKNPDTPFEDIIRGDMIQ